MLEYDIYLNVELSIINATNHEKVLAMLQRYTKMKNYIKGECRKNRISYRRCVKEQRQDEKFLKKFDYNEQEDEIITDGQVPF